MRHWRFKSLGEIVHLAQYADGARITYLTVYTRRRPQPRRASSIPSIFD